MKGRILIVDDSATVRTKFEALLSGCGYLTVTAADGLSALSAARKHSLDLVLLDVFMPIMDGVQVCQALRRDDHYHSLPIVMISGASDRELVGRALAAGASDFLVKPVRNEELISAIDLHLLRVVQA